MLRLGQSIRFTQSELKQLEIYTRADPSWIRTMGDLEEYFAQAKRRYADSKYALELYAEYDEKMAILKQVSAGAA